MFRHGLLLRTRLCPTGVQDRKGRTRHLSGCASFGQWYQHLPVKAMHAVCLPAWMTCFWRLLWCGMSSTGPRDAVHGRRGVAVLGRPASLLPFLGVHFTPFGMLHTPCKHKHLSPSPIRRRTAYSVQSELSSITPSQRTELFLGAIDLAFDGLAHEGMRPKHSATSLLIA
jgi:hypothetical protein